VAPVGRPVVVADQRAGERAGLVRLGRGRRDADRLEVVADPLLVAGLLLHVLVEEVAHLALRVRDPARGGGADRVEVPDDVVELEQQRAVALDRQAVGDRVEHDGVGFKGAARLVRADHEIREEKRHSGLQRPISVSARAS
jgi:hypothetical protein